MPLPGAPLHMTTLNQVQLDELHLLEKKLVRKWVFWEEEDDITVIAEQNEIRKQCDSIVEQIDQCIDNNHASEKLVLFMGRFYLEDKSLAPWTSTKSKNISTRFFQRIVADANMKEKCESFIVDKIHNTLQEMKSANLSSEVNSSGYKKTSKLKIGGKLIGSTYTKMLDKMEKFKNDHLTELGHLHFLIEKTDMEKNWRYILPLLLAFLDDTDVLVKREAALLLDMICLKLAIIEPIPANIIIKSQTMPLFKTAIQPLLLALPSLTPETKSVEILLPAYKAIFDLFQVSITDKLEFYNSMSALLNDTLLPSIGKCKDYAQVSLELTLILQEFLQRCGDFSKVLTKQVIYTLLTVLMDPYISFAPAVVSAILLVIQECMASNSAESRKRFKYDVLGCMGILKRRLQNRENHLDANIEGQIEVLVNCVNI